LKVLDAARKLNYVPNSLAGSLTKNKSRMVALIIGTLANPFYGHTLHAFSQALKKAGKADPEFHSVGGNGVGRSDPEVASISG
jgi:DNA-binding LacI/PurR family transcriptional regulator